MATKKKKQAPVIMPGPAWYDPALKENQRQSRRSLSDLESDAGEGGTQQTRLASQWGINQADAARQRAELGEDYETNVGLTNRTYGRGLEDLIRDRGYTQEDYGTNLADLQRQFDRLGSAQTQQTRSAGLAGGGAFAQSAQKRAANQAYARKPIDTSYTRAMDASTTGERRLGEDKASDLSALERSYTRGGGAIDRALASQGTQYGYDVNDLGQQVGRAQRDQTFFDRASQNAILRQAASAGWAPPAPAKKKKAGRK